MAPPTPQVHQPQQFHLALRLALLATGTNAAHEALHRTIWVEAEPDATTIHASTGDRYIRTNIPATRPGQHWRHILHMPDDTIKHVAAQAKPPPPAATEIEALADRVTIQPQDDDRVAFDLVKPGERSEGGAVLPIVPLDWPTEYVEAYDLHASEDLFELPATDLWFGFVAKVKGVLRQDLQLVLGHSIIRFEAQSEAFPDVRVQGWTQIKPSA